jgi:sulfide:quinone oxidoreductase
MKHLVILGAGTAGTMVANRVCRGVPANWSVSVVDPSPRHLFQPGLVSFLFGDRKGSDLERPRASTLSPRINWIREAIRAIEPGHKRAIVGSSPLHYDLLVIASGATVHPEANAHQPYTLAGALALREALETFQEGRLVVSLPETPIKGPAAPLELLFLADELFTLRGIRDRVELVLATPHDHVWEHPRADAVFSRLLASKGIAVERGLRDGRTLACDLLVRIPRHRGAPFLEGSGLADELGFVPVEPRTLRVPGREDIFVLGDAAKLPCAKAGSVAHFQSLALVENLLRAIAGRSLREQFDGHMSCFVESGWGRALLLDGNYDVEPVAGLYPLPWVGPLRLLNETRLSHWTRSAVEPLYWRALLPAHWLPIPYRMPRLGKRLPRVAREAHA